MPAGIEFECPHCHRVAKVPVTLAGKQGRCAGCRRVLEVPDLRPGPGRTPDPEEGLLEVLEEKKASERVPARRPSDRGPVAPPGPVPLPEELPKTEDDGTTTSLHVYTPPPPRALTWKEWARKVPPLVWFGLPLSVPFPALGLALCVLAIRRARLAGAGERLAWTGIGIGATILALNIIYVAVVVARRS